MSGQTINSKEYWNNRFLHNWEENQGRGQTAFFGQVAIEALPEWLIDDIKQGGLSIADVGCAEGEATNILSDYFVTSDVSGIDFSTEAIIKASSHYPELNFVTADINDLEYVYDVVFSSNTLEHFADPLSIMHKLTRNSRKYMIFLLPFQEYLRTQEHFFTFDYQSFPLKINNFVMLYFKEIDCTKYQEGHWLGKQILVVYGKDTVIDLSNQNLESANGNISLLQQLENDVKGLNRTINELKSQKAEILKEREALIQVREAIVQERGSLRAELDELLRLLQSEQQSLKDTMQENYKLSQRIFKLERRLDEILQSDFWKLAKKYYHLRDSTKFRYVYKSAKVIRSSGFKVFLHKAFDKLFHKNRKLHSIDHQIQLNKILKKHRHKPIIIFPCLVDWNIPLFQRPQHIAQRLARRNFLYFYCSPNAYDNVSGFKELHDNCFLTNRLDLLLEIDKKKIIHLYSTDMNPTNEMINACLEKGDVILYEYIDEIHEELSGEIPQYVWDKHKQILRNEKCIVIASAEKLYNEVKDFRSNNMELVTNGVDYDHFSQRFDRDSVPSEIRIILNKEKPIIGYYGAFASWFDYDLVKELATKRPEYEILLIGWNYDESMTASGLDQFENISVIGPINYNVLPNYAYWFDVSMIPFKLNQVTESTSPIKLFEYMALGRPIVTTDLPECRKYNSVFIGKEYDKFIDCIDHSLNIKNDDNYRSILKAEALDNTWDAKAEAIANLIKENI